MISYITAGFCVTACCHTCTRKYWIFYPQSSYLQHIYNKGLSQNLDLQVCLRKSYTTTTHTECNHNLTWSLGVTKPSFRSLISHVNYTMGWPNKWCQKNPPLDSLRSSYPFSFLHSGMHPNSKSIHVAPFVSNNDSSV